jgi:hypothetical protein
MVIMRVILSILFFSLTFVVWGQNPNLTDEVKIKKEINDIKLTGDASGEASFNGTANAEIAVEIPDLDTLGNSIDTINKSLNKEAYLNWGGKVLSGSVSPVDAASSYLHSANRF